MTRVNDSLPFLRLLRGIAVLGFALLVLTACSSGLSVRSDADPTADFSRYRTWDFFDPMGIEGGYNSPIYGELFREAIEREMTERGYRRAEHADLLVNVTMRADDKVKVTSYTNPYMSGAYYGYPGRVAYGSATGVGVGVSTRATRTSEASVFIDLVDASRHRVLWQGVAVANVTDKVAQQLRDSVNTAVERIFAIYPHTAGH